MGQNGSGKSTLLDIISGLILIQEVFINKIPIWKILIYKEIIENKNYYLPIMLCISKSIYRNDTILMSITNQEFRKL